MRTLPVASLHRAACAAVAASRTGVSRRCCAKLTGSDVVPVHHADPEILKEIVRCGPDARRLLLLFEREERAGAQYGWLTAKETINRIAKGVVQRKRAAAGFRAADERFQRLMAIPALALEQNVMDSKARMGHSTDDLRSLKESIEALKLADGDESACAGPRLHRLLSEKLAEDSWRRRTSRASSGTISRAAPWGSSIASCLTVADLV